MNWSFKFLKANLADWPTPDTVTHWVVESLEDVLDGEDENDVGDNNINNRT